MQEGWVTKINGRDILKIDEKNGGNLKKIPAESQLTTRYNKGKTVMLVAGCYRDFLKNIKCC